MTAFDPKIYIKTLPAQPGVYRMLNDNQEVIYVGKARNLKKRVESYFVREHEDLKTQTLVSQIASMEIIITGSENEALLLENNLIKELQPRYNILFKDDKSYPYLQLTNDEFPQLTSHRGSRKPGYKYFGPYPTYNTARESLHLLQKIFKLRNCQNSNFANRSRPCLQYQIKRCSAPCVKFISNEDYAKDVRLAELFLAGKNKAILTELIQYMDLAAEQLNFEKAALLRDQITILRRAQEQQYMHAKSGDIDVIVVLQQQNKAIVELLMVRHGQVIGNKAFFPKILLTTNNADILSEFIAQHYLAKDEPQFIPKEIVVSATNENIAWIANTLSEQAGRQVKIISKVRAAKRYWLQLAEKNAEHELKTYLANKTNLNQRFQALTDILQLTAIPTRLECFDISHTQGESTIASCVVFDQSGPLKNDYRRFNIEGITGGDDYAAMFQALQRRYTRIQKEEGKLPDILIIDGGKGQLTQAKQVLTELGITDVLLLGIAKGSTRKAGLEQVILGNAEDKVINIPADSPALHLLQHIRDEAHRFAITTHRQKQRKNRAISPLQAIPGIGAKRRRCLLQHFGGIQELTRVSIEEIAKVPGISRTIAERIFHALHP